MPNSLFFVVVVDCGSVDHQYYLLLSVAAVVIVIIAAIAAAKYCVASENKRNERHTFSSIHFYCCCCCCSISRSYWECVFKLCVVFILIWLVWEIVIEFGLSNVCDQIVCDQIQNRRPNKQKK